MHKLRVIPAYVFTHDSLNPMMKKIRPDAGQCLRSIENRTKYQKQQLQQIYFRMYSFLLKGPTV